VAWSDDNKQRKYDAHDMVVETLRQILYAQGRARFTLLVMFSVIFKEQTFISFHLYLLFTGLQPVTLLKQPLIRLIFK
jgi:hypothetical protein